MLFINIIRFTENSQLFSTMTLTWFKYISLFSNYTRLQYAISYDLYFWRNLYLTGCCCICIFNNNFISVFNFFLNSSRLNNYLHFNFKSITIFITKSKMHLYNIIKFRRQRNQSKHLNASGSLKPATINDFFFSKTFLQKKKPYSFLIGIKSQLEYSFSNAAIWSLKEE